MGIYLFLLLHNIDKKNILNLVYIFVIIFPVLLIDDDVVLYKNIKFDKKLYEILHEEMNKVMD